jgi:hypothetical protein
MFSLYRLSIELKVKKKCQKIQKFLEFKSTGEPHVYEAD